jgi:hypothetical protein
VSLERTGGHGSVGGQPGGGFSGQGTEAAPVPEGRVGGQGQSGGQQGGAFSGQGPASAGTLVSGRSPAAMPADYTTQRPRGRMVLLRMRGQGQSWQARFAHVREK